MCFTQNSPACAGELLLSCPEKFTQGICSAGLDIGVELQDIRSIGSIDKAVAVDVADAGGNCRSSTGLYCGVFRQHSRCVGGVDNAVTVQVAQFVVGVGFLAQYLEAVAVFLSECLCGGTLIAVYRAIEEWLAGLLVEAVADSISGIEYLAIRILNGERSEVFAAGKSARANFSRQSASTALGVRAYAYTGHELQLRGGWHQPFQRHARGYPQCGFGPKTHLDKFAVSF